jgi:hypothetical protein
MARVIALTHKASQRMQQLGLLRAIVVMTCALALILAKAGLSY